jgi:hypothetical protein
MNIAAVMRRGTLLQDWCVVVNTVPSLHEHKNSTADQELLALVPAFQITAVLPVSASKARSYSAVHPLRHLQMQQFMLKRQGGMVSYRPPFDFIAKDMPFLFYL